MKRLLVPVMLLFLSGAQLVRIERLAADSPDVRPRDTGRIQPTGTAARGALAIDPATPISNPPYIIEPPDVLTIDLVAATARKGRLDAEALKKFTEGDGDNKFLVAADGKIDLHGLGRVDIAGLTIESAEEAIKAELCDHFDAPAVNVSVANYSSKAVFIIFRGLVGGDMVERCLLPYPRTADVNVGNYLANSCRADGFPALADLASAIISVRRPSPDGVGPEQVLAVEWDKTARRPNEETNHILQASDRIFVEFRRSENHEQEAKSPSASAIPGEIPRTDIPAATPIAGPYGAAAPQGRKPAEGTEMVFFEPKIFVGLENSLAAFEDLEKDGGTLIEDATTLQAALRILEKNRLIEIISKPKLMVLLGRHANLRVGAQADDNGKDISDWLKLSLQADRKNGQLVVSYDLEKTHAGLHYRAKGEQVLIDEGQSILVRAHGEKGNPETPDVRPLYMLIAPSIPDRAEWERAHAKEVRYPGVPTTEPPGGK